MAYMECLRKILQKLSEIQCDESRDDLHMLHPTNLTKISKSRAKSTP